MYSLKTKKKDITYGQRKLLDLLDHRKLMAFSREHNLSFVYVFNIAIGKNFPPPVMIFNLRSIIPPETWFFKESDPLPPGHIYSIKSAYKDWDYTKSIAYKAFQKTENLKGFCRDNDLQYTSLTLVHRGKRAPSFQKIKLLMNVFYPADWFFSPDEIKD